MILHYNYQILLISKIIVQFIKYNGKYYCVETKKTDIYNTNFD